MDNQTNTTLPQQPQNLSVDELKELTNKLISAQNTKVPLRTKLTSRKFWVSAAGCVSGICGMIGFSDNTVAIIVFGIVEVVSILAFCISEGTLDAMHKKQLMESISTLIGMIADAAANSAGEVAVASAEMAACETPVYTSEVECVSTETYDSGAEATDPNPD